MQRSSPTEQFYTSTKNTVQKLLLLFYKTGPCDGVFLKQFHNNLMLFLFVLLDRQRVVHCQSLKLPSFYFLSKRIKMLQLILHHTKQSYIILVLTGVFSNLQRSIVLYSGSRSSHSSLTWWIVWYFIGIQRKLKAFSGFCEDFQQ